MKILILALLLFPFLAGAQTTSFTVSKDTLCRDSCIILINTSTGAADSIRWYIPGITIASPHSDTLNVCFPSAGINTARLYVFRGGVTDTAIQLIQVKPSPHPMLTFNMAHCIMRVPAIYASYQWYHMYGAIITGATSDSIFASMDYFYVVVDSNGCLGRSDTLAGCTEGKVRNTNPRNSSVSFYPNPTSSTLTITSTDKISQITITNLLGQTLLTRNYNSERVEVDLSDLPSGVYILRINGSEVRKFVKE